MPAPDPGPSQQPRDRGRPPRERGVLFVASLGGSISAEHGIGALKAQWLPLARTDAERALFARIRSALDPSATLNPNGLPRLSGRWVGWHLQQAAYLRGARDEPLGDRDDDPGILRKTALAGSVSNWGGYGLRLLRKFRNVGSPFSYA